MKTSLITF